MDFKVAGTQKGVTGIQLDLKIDGISEEIIRATLVQARDARIELLKTMLSTIRRPRSEISSTAPRLLRTKIDPSKIGLLIGPGGKNIRALQEETGTTIDINDDGTVIISCDSAAGAEDALAPTRKTSKRGNRIRRRSAMEPRCSRRWRAATKPPTAHGNAAVALAYRWHRATALPPQARRAAQRRSPPAVLSRP